MDLQHVNVKIFVDGDLTVDPARFIEIFHSWVQQQSMDEMMIDVADYRHVPAGPGVVLVGHESDYAMDNAENRYGLLYNRKAVLEGSNHDRFRHSLEQAAHACRLLEVALDGEAPLRFDRRDFELIINDRALAPNTPQTYAECKADLESFLNKTLGHSDFNLQHRDDPRRRFSVNIKLKKPLDLEAIAVH